MKFPFPSLAVWLLAIPSLFSQRSLLQSGPMVGYSEMREVMLWVQTNAPAAVQFSYWPQDHPEQVKMTTTYNTFEEEAFTARLIADEVEPGTNYDYQLKINGKAVSLDFPTTFQTQALWQWRGDPPNFTFALGSCAYINETVYDRPGNPYGGDYGIFESIKTKDPDMMLWLGDNIYLREVDWYSWTGILKRYTHARSLREMQPLLASTHNYAIWDDHDFGPDNSDRGFVHKDKTLRAFELFWANPGYGIPESEGITGQFQWADADFSLLDNRYHRSPDKRKTGDKTMFGEAQFEWLIDALSSSQAAFKFVVTGGVVLNSAKGGENYVNVYPEERTRLLKLIEEEGIKNVVFLTGDVHFTELSKLELNNGIVVHDFTVSPLTSGVNTYESENIFRVPGTKVQARNFATIQVTGPRTQRSLTLRVFNSAGEELWVQTISQQQ
ncbi:MAG: alkaline phosphatase family protein [Saprospirales bacterium]|nr:alkaline phosphatase family protein [Saprospirales bacterium]